MMALHIIVRRIGLFCIKWNGSGRPWNLWVGVHTVNKRVNVVSLLPHKPSKPRKQTKPLPRFNEKFGVQAEQDYLAYRRLEQSGSLGQILCFKHRRKDSRDNTTKYKRRTLQLLPGGTRSTYAGVQVEVQEDLEGRLLVQYQGQAIPTQEAPPRPGLLRATAAPL